MSSRLKEFIAELLKHKDYFHSANSDEWTAEQQKWEKSWSSYVQKGGERPPTPPPHA